MQCAGAGDLYTSFWNGVAKLMPNDPLINTLEGFCDASRNATEDYDGQFQQFPVVVSWVLVFEETTELLEEIVTTILEMKTLR